ncbi:hypothetical protein PUN28_003982 [Cardiocondyla obscurior]|uniref:Uncharacterized protein n=1 Tax=Cardiocondyla obscurior TaxID=286306 RepID=A0AAW2GPF2_9HYME
MKIYAGWYFACAVLCACAHSTKPTNKMYYSSSFFYPTSTANDYDYDAQLSAAKLFDESEEFEEKRPPTTMRAIVARAETSPVLLPLIIEPEAEMLPAGYKGVKSPGVTHMELAFVKPKIRPPSRKSVTLRTSVGDGNSDKSDEFNKDNDAHYAASKYETQAAKKDRNSHVVFEAGSKGDARKENDRSEYTEVSGASKSHSKNEDRAKNHKEKVVKDKGTTHEIRDGHEKARNTAGYRNVYHRDEFKKDADFYNNGRHGRHFERHGRYGEKHDAAEDKRAKGKSNDSKFIEVEANEQKKFKEMPERQFRSLRLL